MGSKRGRKASDDDDFIPEDPAEERERERDAVRGQDRRRGNGKGKVEALAITNVDFRKLRLKDDHASRPLWVTPSGLIVLEAFSPMYHKAYDFLVAIAEPVARPQFIHKYQLTQDSLYSAVAVAIETERIISLLKKLCKTELPQEVENFIRSCTSTFGKAKLILKDNKFYVESEYPDVLRGLLQIDIIRNARESGEAREALEAQIAYDKEQKRIEEEEMYNPNLMKDGFSVTNDPSGTQRSTVTTTTTSTTINNSSSSSSSEFLQSVVPRDMKRNTDFGLLINEDDDDEDGAEGDTANDGIAKVSFLIAQDQVQEVKRCAQEVEYPLMEEYDYRHSKNPDLRIDLRPSTKIRTYQVKSLSKMFGNSRARSGIIVLPCGAGKSLTGITAASTIRKSTMVLCWNNSSVKQWKEQFMMFTTIPEKSIRLFTSEFKDILPSKDEACVVISTYTMISHSGRRSDMAQTMIDSISEREWGLMILDEVHVAPARMFRRVMSVVNAHCKLGLTATLVREDNLISHLNFLVGPKLYEANWMDLTQQGYLANVQCCEVWCPMTTEFYEQYLSDDLPSRNKQLLYVLNPTKVRACDYLVKYHEKRGDKIIIFCDDIAALEVYCELVQCKMIWGETPERDRREVLDKFKSGSEINTIGLSRVGDVALDLPEASVIIQVASHFGARRQEAQRLGRILRPKPNPTGGFNAFFYTMVSTDTKEMYHSSKRQQYLIDQGYTFKVLQDLVMTSEKESKLMKEKKQEVDVLSRIIALDASAKDQQEAQAIDKHRKQQDAYFSDDDEDEHEPIIKRRQGTTSAISGGQGVSYIEYDHFNDHPPPKRSRG